MTIPFTKAHGASNDFLLTWEKDVPAGDRARMAIAICDRHTGVGADGWMLVSPATDDSIDGAIQLYNSDGSIAEMSGNGTRCAAAFLIRHGHAAEAVRVRTGAGPKYMRVLARRGLEFDFEMNMGSPTVKELHHPISAGGRNFDATLLWVGNPQCSIPVEDFDFDWRACGAELERHPDFPNRSNISFVKVIDRHTIDVRFWERGAGETMSSGTGSTGAAACAVERRLVEPPVRVLTPAGALETRCVSFDYFLTGPAVIFADGTFFM